MAEILEIFSLVFCPNDDFINTFSVSLTFSSSTYVLHTLHMTYYNIIFPLSPGWSFLYKNEVYLVSDTYFGYPIFSQSRRKAWGHVDLYDVSQYNLTLTSPKKFRHHSRLINKTFFKNRVLG